MKALFPRFALAILASLLPMAASAHEPYEQPPVWGDTKASTMQDLPACSDASWATPIVRVHTAEFSGTGKSAMMNAVREINAQIANVGASSAHIDKTVETTDAFHSWAPYVDTTPTIHVGFYDLVKPAIAYTSAPYSCERFI